MNITPQAPEPRNSLTPVYRWGGLVLFLGICWGAAALGVIATTPEIPGWYQTLNKPAWNPPAWVFGPVWTTLYTLMAIAGWLVWQRQCGRWLCPPLLWFWGQLALNVAWSWIFFGMHQPGWAFAEILLLLMTIAATVVIFAKHSRLAAVIMVPYLAWVSFAAVLNAAIWQLN